MENNQYITFSSHNLRYGVEAAWVQEIFPIPELTPILEISPDLIIGIMNLRKQIVPIIHLGLIQNPLLKSCKISDYIIILRQEELLIGLVVQQLDEMLELNPEEIDTEHSFGLISDLNKVFVDRVIKVDSGNIIILKIQALIRQLDAVLPFVWDAQMQVELMATSPTSVSGEQIEKELFQQSEDVQIPQVISTFFDLYCPDATSADRAILRQRADSLKLLNENSNDTLKLTSIVVFSFGNNYFGLDLELVKEFANIHNFTPIPGCPNHIVGNMNLRGEIVTLVDIRNILNLPTVPVSLGDQTVVVQVDDIIAGLPVDRVLEMVYLNSADLIPSSESLADVGEQYIRGSAFFQEKMLKIVDLPKLFLQGNLAVNEEI